MYGSSDSEATAKKSSSLSVTVAGVSCLPRVLRRGIEDGCSWCRYNLNASRLYSISLHPNAKENKHHITKEKNYTVNKKDARREIHTRMNILRRPSRVVLGKHPRYMPRVSEFASLICISLTSSSHMSVLTIFPLSIMKYKQTNTNFLNVAPMVQHLQKMEE